MTKINKISILTLVLILTSCYGINGLMNYKKYYGEWKLEKIDHQYFDISGKDSTIITSTPSGKLTLNKASDGKYSFQAIGDTLNLYIPTSGKWKLYYKTKMDVLVFEQNRATVSEKSKSKLVFHTDGGQGNGKLYIRRIFHFTK